MEYLNISKYIIWQIRTISTTGWRHSMRSLISIYKIYRVYFICIFLKYCKIYSMFRYIGTDQMVMFLNYLSCIFFHHWILRFKINSWQKCKNNWKIVLIYIFKKLCYLLTVKLKYLIFHIFNYIFIVPFITYLSYFM